MTAALEIYAWIARGPGAALARRALAWRARRGKEDPERLPERRGVASVARPPGCLAWLHAASVGEALSLLPLIEALRRRRPDLAVLATTGTRTAAALMAQRLPQAATHQYAPVDTHEAVTRFLDHWRPDVLAIAESEVWPTMLRETSRRGAPIALVSARISESSARGWARAPRTAKALFSLIDLILPQTDAAAERFRRLGAPRDRVRVFGSLKWAADPPPDAPTERADIAQAIGDRPIWLAASTHAGEETAAIAAHRVWAERIAAHGGAERPLTIVAPRHPERAEAVVEEGRRAGFRVALRSEAETPPACADLFVVDRIGELGVWYRLSPIAFVGGGLTATGGHNPLEPARLGAAILSGLQVDAFSEEYRRLFEAGGAATVETPDALATRLLELTGPDGRANERAEAMAETAARFARDGDAVAERTAMAVLDLLGASGAAGATAEAEDRAASTQLVGGRDGDAAA